MDFDIYILAGGKSSRMKREKGLVQINNKSMIEHVIDANVPFQQPIHIITNSDQYAHLPYPCISDIHQEIGPLGGLHAALTHCSKKGLLLLSCDTPFVQHKFLQTIIKARDTSFQAIIPSFQNKIHPLLGWYNKTAIALVEKQISLQNYRMTDLIDKLKTKQLDCSHFPTSFFQNINCPKDLP